MNSTIERIPAGEMETKNQIKISRSSTYGFRYFIDADTIAQRLIARSHAKPQDAKDTKRNVPQTAYVLKKEE
jgi:hypothetical protein